jgi:hypothetical protein
MKSCATQILTYIVQQDVRNSAIQIFGHTILVELFALDNQFSGTIPKLVDTMISIQYLSLGDNTFSGPIPGELYKCNKLNKLYLLDNHFNGTLSTCIDELPGLEYSETPF